MSMEFVVGVVLGVAGFLGILVVTLYAAACYLMALIFDSVQPVDDKDSTWSREPKLKDENVKERNPLFRHLPNLKEKLAWNELGVYPTPLHQLHLQKSADSPRLSFWMKREDLASPLYGGNKVRTLQYQFPACQLHRKNYPDSKFYIIGSGGSNQVVASMVYGRSLDLNFHVCYPSPDIAELDNTLNLLSTLSFGPESWLTWERPLATVKLVIKAIFSKKDKVIGLGGNSVGGILGQIGGALELAEQIEAGLIPDVDEIYLAMGSGCTTTGLILGICLARHLKMNAFRSPLFKVVSLLIHGGMAAANRTVRIMTSKLGDYIFVSPRFGIRRVAPFLKELSGIDLEADAFRFLEQEWDLVDIADYIGNYGAHCPKSAEASAYDSKLEVHGPCPEWIKSDSPPIPWLCGHFTGKVFGVLLDRLEEYDRKNEKVNALFWQTKSSIQPLSDSFDEWTALKNRAKESAVLKKWTDEGKETSTLRPGKVDLDNGTPADYRHIMTPIVVNNSKLNTIGTK